MRTRRRRLPRTRAAARLPGSLKFGVTGDASANPCDGKRALLAEVHAIEQAQCSHQCLAPDPGYYLLMTLFYTATTRASLCAQASDDSLVEDTSSARMSATTPWRPGSAPSPPDGSGRAREPPGSYPGQSRSFQSSLVLLPRPGSLIYGCAIQDVSDASAPQPQRLTKRARDPPARIINQSSSSLLIFDHSRRAIIRRARAARAKKLCTHRSTEEINTRKPKVWSRSLQ